ncbi:MAG: asparagine synthase (glutamine-hydrolyzing) [Granulosicoccus sp.]|jgi:asparagine synthase (glutamine-hydrolysing)
MCGIAGFHSSEQTLGKTDLQLMTSKIRHRGPDAKGHFIQNGIGLGHRRLSIVDLSPNSNQPFFSADGRFVMVYNGEVYNHKEVAKELGIIPRTTSDTEVIIEAFVKKGPEMVKMLNGMFAIAIYDKKEERLFLFRDRLGIKPLYYSEGEDFLFGSELKSLIGLIKNPKIDQEAVAKFLHMGYIPEPHSIYTAVKKFPSAHYAELCNGQLQLQCYWNVEDQIRPMLITDGHLATDQLEKLLFDSVGKRLMSDVPFGTFLSGGIDSSLVTAMAQANSTTPIKTFSIGSVEKKYNETEFARAVSKHLGTEHFEYMVSEQDAMDLVSDLPDHYDEPYADSSAIPTMLVSKMARKEVTMTLSGDGGDELFMGYGAYNWAHRLNQPHIKALRRPIGALLKMGSDHKKRAAKLFNWKDESRLPSHIFSQEQCLFSEAEVNQLLVAPANAAPDNQILSLSRNLDPAEIQAFYDLRYYLKDDLLTKVDRATMKYSLETRVPILDHRIVEFALNISPSLKMKNGEMKHLLKNVLYRHVPKKIFDRPKWGFSIPLVKWLNGDLAYLIDDHLSKASVESCGLVKWPVVQQLVKSYRSGESHLYNRLWLLIMLHLWAKKVHNQL